MLSGSLKKQEKYLVYLILALLVPAYFINLGMQSFNEDEAIRAIVAYEMMHSGNYIVPTINGLPYYYKPPLYNYFLVLSFYFFGVVNEWSARVPTIIFLGLFAIAIYRCMRYYMDTRKSILTSLWFLTCGRILFWDSMLAFIDIAYSLVSFLVMFLSFHLYQKKRYWLLFISVFFLTAIGYLLKGFPSFLFLFFSLITVSVYFKNYKIILHPGFWTGLFIMIAMIGGYYYLYSLHHDAGNTLGPLLDQSTRRTIVRFGIIDVVKHIFIYPLENIYHFFPYTIPGLLLLNKEVFKQVFSKEYLVLFALLFVSNILVYWVSPEVYPRYILMHLPLAFAVNIFGYETAYRLEIKAVKYVEYLFLSIPMIGIILAIAGMFHPFLSQIPYAITIVSCVIIILSILFILGFKNKHLVIWYSVLSLLIIRIGFNFLVIPERHDGDPGAIAKKEIYRIKDTYPDKPIKLWKNSIMDKNSSFYLAVLQGKPNETTDTFDKSNYYVVDTMKVDFPKEKHVVLDSFLLREFDRMCYLIETAN